MHGWFWHGSGRIGEVVAEGPDDEKVDERVDVLKGVDGVDWKGVDADVDRDGVGEGGDSVDDGVDTKGVEEGVGGVVGCGVGVGGGGVMPAVNKIMAVIMCPLYQIQYCEIIKIWPLVKKEKSSC